MLIDIASARESATQWARDLLDRKDWVILDTETTGLDDEAEICQIAVIAPDGSTLLDTLVRPSVPIPADATAIHGITNAMVEKAPTYWDINPDLIDILTLPAGALPSRQVVIYNAAYDIRILRQTAEIYSLSGPIPGRRGHCAMLQYSRWFGEWNDYRQDFRWQKLPPIPGQTAHSALADCRSTLRVIQMMAGREGGT